MCFKLYAIYTDLFHVSSFLKTYVGKMFTVLAFMLSEKQQIFISLSPLLL